MAFDWDLKQIMDWFLIEQMKWLLIMTAIILDM